MDSFEELEGDMQRLAELAPYDAFFHSKFVDLASRIRTRVLLDGVALLIPDETVERMIGFAAEICWKLPREGDVPNFDANLMFETKGYLLRAVNYAVLNDNTIDAFVRIFICSYRDDAPVVKEAEANPMERSIVFNEKAADAIVFALLANPLAPQMREERINTQEKEEYWDIVESISGDISRHKSQKTCESISIRVNDHEKPLAPRIMLLRAAAHMIGDGIHPPLKTVLRLKGFLVNCTQENDFAELQGVLSAEEAGLVENARQELVQRLAQRAGAFREQARVVNMEEARARMRGATRHLAKINNRCAENGFPPFRAAKLPRACTGRC
ncbi:hypothetical protein H0O01_05470 [Candidatus Micrarchaeota archaeon]|nr:hypothetical protein [Candidatus Micrarchaeota archaeon]